MHCCYQNLSTPDYRNLCTYRYRLHREARNTITRIERTLQNTPQVILGHMYDRIGFGAIMTLFCAILSSRGKDDNRDYGREVVPALEAVSDGFDVAAVMMYGIE